MIREPRSTGALTGFPPIDASRRGSAKPCAPVDSSCSRSAVTRLARFCLFSARLASLWGRGSTSGAILPAGLVWSEPGDEAKAPWEREAASEKLDLENC